jgi:hypothetical protein
VRSCGADSGSEETGERVKTDRLDALKLARVTVPAILRRSGFQTRTRKHYAILFERERLPSRISCEHGAG